MVKSEKYLYDPDYAVPPGETLQEVLELKSMDASELARRANLTPKTINDIINQGDPITPESAEKFEMVLGIPASFWNNLEKNYRQTLIKIAEIKKLEEYWDWLRTIGIIYGMLVQKKYLENAVDRAKKVQNLLKFFQVSSPEAFMKVYGPASLQYQYRKSQTFDCEIGPLAAWIRKGEIEAERISTKPFDRNQFMGLVGSVRKLSISEPGHYLPELQKICTETGVVLVYVPSLPKCPYGASRWLSDGRPLIQLSGRGRKDDHFWFTFLHEAAHIIFDERDSKSKIFLDGENPSDDDSKEKRANKYAANWLISPIEFKELQLISHDAGSVGRFAGNIGISPGIVVGRLQYEGIISYRSALNSLKITVSLE